MGRDPYKGQYKIDLCFHDDAAWFQYIKKCARDLDIYLRYGKEEQV